MLSVANIEDPQPHMLSHHEPSAKRWYVAQSQPRREMLAKHNLENQDFKVFLPMGEKTRRHARKLETISAPFFPGYLFISLDCARDRWRSVNGTFGVTRLILQGDMPLPVPKGVIEALQNACDEQGALRSYGDLQVGQKVFVISGPFADTIGELTRFDDAGRVRILLSIMGGKVPILLPRKSLIPAINAV